TEPSLEIPQSSAAPAPADDAAAAAAAAPDAADAAAGQTTTQTLVLEPPAPVAPVATTQATDAVPISPADKAKLDGMVASDLDAVSSLDPHSQAFADKVRDIGKLGDDDIRASAAVSNRLLEKPL